MFGRLFCAAQANRFWPTNGPSQRSDAGATASIETAAAIRILYCNIIGAVVTVTVALCVVRHNIIAAIRDAHGTVKPVLYNINTVAVQ